MKRHADDDPLELDMDDARQGEATGHLRYVLVFGLFGIVVAFGGLLLFFI